MMFSRYLQPSFGRMNIKHSVVSSLVCASLLAVIPVYATEKDMLDVSAAPSPRLVSIDWTHTETLLALGVTPVAVAQIPDYNSWVKSPEIPQTVADVGLRTQPNLERLHELKPDKILLSPMFSTLETQLSKIAPVTTIGLYRSGDVDWSALERVTRQLAEVSEKEPQAEALIEQANGEMDRLSTKLPDNAPPMLMVQFMDTNHVRVFGNNSLYKASVNKIGLEGAELITKANPQRLELI